MSKKIYLDGEYFSTGLIQDLYNDFVQGDPENGAPAQPDFNINRLSYDPNALKAEAKEQALHYAALARESIIGETDPVRRDAWVLKGILALTYMMHKDPAYQATLMGGIENAFGIESARRGGDKLPAQLIQESAQSALGMLFAGGLVEGRLRKLDAEIDAIEDNKPDFRDLLATEKAESEKDKLYLTSLQEGKGKVGDRGTEAE